MRDLSPLLAPRSVAVVGASSNLDSLAGRPVRNLRDSGLDLAVYPVNPARDEIGGYCCYPDPASLPEAPDVAVVVTPGSAVLTAVEALAERGARAAIVISAGFGETGDEGRRLQQHMADVASAHGMILCGPNTLGVHDYARGLPLSFVWYGRRPTRLDGSLAVVTQSGSGMTALCDQLIGAGLPLGFGVATGNEADLDVVDVIEYLAEQEQVRVIATVFEQLRDGPRFLSVAARLRELRKPLIALKVGRTNSGSAAVQSHTGALAGSYPTLAALMRQHGVVELTDVDQFGGTVSAALTGKLPGGRGIAVISSSGGAGAICADTADDLGLELPPLSLDMQEFVRKMMPDFAVSGEIANPIDLTAQSMERPHALEEIAERLLAEPYVDVVIHAVPSSGGPPAQAADRASRLADVAERASKPLLSVILTGDEGSTLRAGLVSRGVPTFASPSRAVEVIDRLERFARVGHQTPTTAGDLTTPTFPPWPSRCVSEYEALRWMAQVGLPTIDQRLAATATDAVFAARELGYPVAVKVSSPQIAHKTEVGGVILGLGSDVDVEGAFAVVTENARAASPQGVIEGVTVSPMVESSVELVAGIHVDPLFGPVLVFGLGGIWTELLDDVALRGAPISRGHVVGMVDQLRGAAVLRGARGHAAVRDEDLERLLLTLSHVAMNLGPDIVSVDLNPIAVTREGRLVIVDASIEVSDLSAAT